MNNRQLKRGIIFSCFSFTALLVFCQRNNGTNEKKAEVFAPGIISTGAYERDLAISPDGNEYYFTLMGPRNYYSQVICAEFKNGKWMKPGIATFSGQHYKDLEPAFSPDGKKLFFSSDRPVNQIDSTRDFNIWYVEKITGGWSAPVCLDETVNTGGDEFYPIVTNSGTLYFTASYSNETKDDIYKSEFLDGKFQKPVRLSEPLNSKGYEFNAYVSADEKFIIYTCYGRADDLGKGDLYISFNQGNGHWSTPKNLGDKINSAYMDYCPLVSADKKFLYFTSEKVRQETANGKMNYEELRKFMSGPQSGNADIYRAGIEELLKQE